jgi:hypothetical protein
MSILLGYRREVSALEVISPLRYYLKCHLVYPTFSTILSMETTPTYGNGNSRLLYNKVLYHISTILGAVWYMVIGALP